MARTLALTTVMLFAAMPHQRIPQLDNEEYAEIAAEDEGLHPASIEDASTRLNEHLVSEYSAYALHMKNRAHHLYLVRIATGDVVAMPGCKLLRFPDLLAYQREDHPKRKAVPVVQIAKEVGCRHLAIITGLTH